MNSYVPPTEFAGSPVSVPGAVGAAGVSDTDPRAVDIGRTLDDGPYTALQKWVVLLAALSIVVDGFDGLPDFGFNRTRICCGSNKDR